MFVPLNQIAQAGAIQNIPEEPEEPSRWKWDEGAKQALADGINRQNFGTGFSPSTFSPLTYTDVEGYDPADDADNEGYDPNYFKNVGSPTEARMKRYQVDLELEQLKSIRSSAWGTVGEVTGALLSPEIMIGGGAGGVIKGAAVLGAVEAAKETVLHQQQATRTFKESAIATGTVVGASLILGGAIKYFAKDQADLTAKVTGKQKATVPPEPMQPRPSDAVGSQRAEEWSADDLQLAGGPLAKMLAVGPYAEVFASSSPEAKRIIMQMVDSSFILKGNTKGKATPQSIEAITNSSTGDIAQSMKGVTALQKQSKMPDEEFNSAVSDAIENGGRHANEFVVKAAKEYEKTLTRIYDELVDADMLRGSYNDLLKRSGVGADEFEGEVLKAMRGEKTDLPMAQRTARNYGGKKAGIKTLEDLRGLERNNVIKGAKGYLPHVYQKAKIMADWRGIEGMLTDMIKRDGGKAVSKYSNEQLRAGVNDIMDNMMGGMPLGVQRASSGTGMLSERVISLAAKELAPYMERNASKLMLSYVEGVTPYLEMKKMFGDTNVLGVSKGIRDDYQALMGQAANKPKELARLRKEEERVLELVERMQDRVLRNMHRNSLGTRAAKTIRGITSLNAAIQMGGIVASSVPDLARPLSQYGLKSYSVGLARTLKAAFTGQYKITVQQAQRTGTATERIVNTRAAQMMDDTLETPNKLADALGKWWPKWSGFQIYTDTVEAVSTQVAMDWVITNAKRVAKGKSLSRANKGQLGRMGLDDADLKRIAAEVSDNGGQLQKMDTALWLDKEFAQYVETAIGSDVRRVIIRPGMGDRFLWMDDATGKLLSQYMGFLTGATNRMLVSGLQQRDMAAMLGILSGTFLGAAVAGYKEVARGGDPSDWSAEKWMGEGISRAGFGGIYNIPLSLALQPFDAEGSKYTQQTFGSVFGGPTISQAKNVGSLYKESVDAATGEGDAASVAWAASKFIPTIPIVDAFHFRRLMLESALGEK